VENMPDFSHNLKTADEVKKFQSETGISRVYLFSSKMEVPKIFGALTTNFKNTVRFGFIQENSTEAVKILQE
jgi:hypothetical protein